MRFRTVSDGVALDFPLVFFAPVFLLGACFREATFLLEAICFFFAPFAVAVFFEEFAFAIEIQ